MKFQVMLALPGNVTSHIVLIEVKSMGPKSTIVV